MILHRAPARLVLPFRLGWPARALLAVMAASAVATLFLNTEAASALMALTVPFGLISASVTFLRRAASLEPKERRAWRLIGAGMGIGGLGVIVLAIMLVAEPDTAAFGPTDLVYLTGYGVTLVGLGALPHTHGTGLQRIRLLFDGLIGAVAVATLLWVVFLEQVTAALGDAPTWQRIVGSTYVLLDVSIIVVAMLVVVRRSNLRFDLRLVLFSLAAISIAGADVMFLVRSAGRSFAEAEPVYALFLIAVMLFFLTALVVDKVPQEKEYAERIKTPLWAMGLPYGSAALMISFLVARFPSFESSADASLLYATLTIGALVVARQAFAIRENRRLVEDQQAALVSSISHELRTPLTAMIGFLELLNSDAAVNHDERDEMTAIVNEQAAYMSRIVSDLVMLASEKIATMDLDISPTAIDDLAWASVSNVQIDSTTVRVHAQRNVVAYVDAGRLKQAMSNLLSNAARYGGEKVLIVAQSEGGDLQIEVHDDGPGVPRKYELLVWEKFERGPHRLNAAVPGSGIGLSVTRAIAEAHGGLAGYRKSERLGGACFWMRLPGRVHEYDLQGKARGTQLTVIDRAGNARSA